MKPPLRFKQESHEELERQGLYRNRECWINGSKNNNNNDKKT